ncbi:MAG: exodeoxyribonuclease VII small subunit [Erysipelotrichaceae bacterium]|nr:MAG: exodeoxyribonuclease VII small [Erysipelotrichaceae bacterium]TXT16510.1 MAG: exodeoxyribonuclease VII small subunit [Erysipelotrichaceae bacterium]
MEKKNFEASMKRLNEIVTALEKNESSLEQSISLFEEGLALVKECDLQLKGFEQKVQELMKTYGNSSNAE